MQSEDKFFSGITLADIYELPLKGSIHTIYLSSDKVLIAVKKIK